MSNKLAVAYPDEDLFSALTKMIARRVGRLPVVEPKNAETVVGVITRADIRKAIERSRSTRSWGLRIPSSDKREERGNRGFVQKCGGWDSNPRRPTPQDFLS